MAPMDDLQRIIPDKIQQLGNRKLLLLQGIIILVLLALVIILAAVLGARHADGSTGHAASAELVGFDGTCATPDCLHLAGFLADNMDMSVDPCQDFHSYACGGFRKRHHLAPDQDEVTMIQGLSAEADERVRELIENPTGGGAKTPSEAKLRDFFLSCVHDYGRTKEGGRVLVNLMREKLGGWYVLDPDNWNREWNLQEAVARVQGELLVTVFFDVYLVRDYQRDYPTTKRTMLALYHPGTGMWPTFDSENPTGVQDAYKDYMRRVAALLLRNANVTLTPSEEAIRVEQFVDDAFGMEFQLTSTMRYLHRSRLLYEKITTTLGQINLNFTQLNWLNIVQRMLGDLQLTESTPVRLMARSYFATVNELLQNDTDSRTKDRVLNNYLAWRIASRYSAELSWDYREAGIRYMTALYGESEWEPTWKTCLNTVYQRLGTLLATEFIRSHTTPDVKNQVNEMVSGLRSAITQRILELPWMDDLTQQKAIEKITSVKTFVGFAEAYHNESLMEELHSMLEVDRSIGYFRNLLNVNKFQRRMKARLLVDKEETFMEHLPVVGDRFHYMLEPYFSIYFNALLIPVGAILDPMYSTRRPQIFNYGILGTLLAGDILETIGQWGRYAWINETYVLWWTNATSNEFKKINQCFVQYFDGLTVGPFAIDNQNLTVPVSGNFQTQKLMGDLGGIRAAFRAYKEWTKSNGNEALPVGHRLSHDQLFFVASAQTKCYLRTDAESYERARMGILPEDLELNSLLSHMPEFTDAYQCPVGSKMRASYRCETF